MTSCVATLISHPDGRSLSHALAHSACAAVGASGPDWLADHIACDIALPHTADPRAAEAAIRAALGSAPLDIIVQRVAGRRKKLLIADMDSTMIDQECIDELADEAGIKPHVAAITARAMNGEIAFEPALRERVALLKGLPASVVAQVLESRITLASGARMLVSTMKRNGAWTALVSGGFTAFTGPVAERIGFDEHIANRLCEAEGKLTGVVADPVLGRAAKAEALVTISARLGIEPGEAIAVGDGANDLDMLAIAGAGVALHAKPSVAAQARMRVDHGDLTALLYIQGYRIEDFVE